ncbi:MAG: MbnP family protein, partial [Opitutaceae bacterium]
MEKFCAERNCRGEHDHSPAKALAVGALLVLGCTAPLPAADLTIAIAPRWRGMEIAVPSATLTNDAGQTLGLTRFAALFSEVSLLRADGGMTRLDGQFGFIALESGRRKFVLRSVPEGDFVGLEFHLGVPATL